jgi:hypothetical protein
VIGGKPEPVQLLQITNLSSNCAMIDKPGNVIYVYYVEGEEEEKPSILSYFKYFKKSSSVIPACSNMLFNVPFAIS